MHTPPLARSAGAARGDGTHRAFFGAALALGLLAMAAAPAFAQRADSVTTAHQQRHERATDDHTSPPGPGHTVHLQARPQVQAPGYGKLEFEAPAAGTYQLPAFGDAADGDVLLTNSTGTNLHALMGDRFVVLSFIYTRCPDPNGCTLATHVLRRLHRRVSNDPALASQVRFLSLSFDPTWDTPEVMREYGQLVFAQRGVGKSDDRAAVPWEFLTTASTADLAPILDAYDQTVIQARDEQGNLAGSFSHILRVYLIDRERRLRNIYSVPFLHPDILAADLLTLLADEAQQDDAREAR